jgi:AcrR family transcriptional regulator
MEMIITRSGLSTGAVYGYFKGKDEIINAVVTDGTAAMGRQLVPILKNPEPPSLPQFAEQLLRTVADFGRDKPGGIDRLLVSLHGWSHSQSDPGLKAATRTAYRGQRELFAETVRRWQAAGTFDPGASPEGVAELLQSIILGFVAQRALTGDADVQAHARALDALTRRCPADVPGAGAPPSTAASAEARGTAFSAGPRHNARRPNASAG